MKKLVYVYLVRYAEEQQDLALLSISTFQRGLKVSGLVGAVWEAWALGPLPPESVRRGEVGVWGLGLLSSLSEKPVMATPDRTPPALTPTGVKELWPTARRTQVTLRETVPGQARPTWSLSPAVRAVAPVGSPSRASVGGADFGSSLPGTG